MAKKQITKKQITKKQITKKQIVRRPYVMTWSARLGTINLYGPFKTEKAAAAWGRKWQAANNDDPEWNTIMIADSMIAYPALVYPVTVMDVDEFVEELGNMENEIPW